MQMAAPPPQAKKSLIQEFKEFLNQGDFVTIAVGLIIALYFKSIVDAVLLGVVFPIIAAIFGKPDFQDIGFDIGDARISIGLVINAIVSFIVVGFLLFLIVKAWNRFKQMGGDAAAAAETELSVLRDIRASLRDGGRGPA
jgi:large conductance mechanosensitive channel